MSKGTQDRARQVRDFQLSEICSYHPGPTRQGREVGENKAWNVQGGPGNRGSEQGWQCIAKSLLLAHWPQQPVPVQGGGERVAPMIRCQDIGVSCPGFRAACSFPASCSPCLRASRSTSRNEGGLGWLDRSRTKGRGTSTCPTHQSHAKEATFPAAPPVCTMLAPSGSLWLASLRAVMGGLEGPCVLCAPLSSQTDFLHRTS